MYKKSQRICLKKGRRWRTEPNLMSFLKKKELTNYKGIISYLKGILITIKENEIKQNLKR
jgi:hypothetical protein